MGSYPPPPPGGPGGQYDPRWLRNQARAQRRIMKDQLRLQRAQLRAQRRSLRRGSLVGPILLLTLGMIFLLAQFGRLSWVQSLDWYARWWPGVLIAAGLVLLAEWAFDQHRHSVAGAPPVSRALGGGVVFLLILLVLAGLSARAIETGAHWHMEHFGNGYTKLDQVFGDRHDAYDSVSSPIAPGSLLTIQLPHGDVTVTGSSTDGQVHVSVHTQAYAWKEVDAADKATKLRPVFGSDGKDLVLTVAQVQGGEADLTIEVPHNSPVTVQADRGDVTLSQLHGAVTLSANHGDVDLSNIDGLVSAHVNNDDSSFTAHTVTGDVSVEGRGGDIDVADITGAVHLHGDFFGTTHVEHVTGGLRFESSRTRFSAARLDDEFSIDHDSLDASELLGPVVLSTVDKNITLDRVQGGVDITNRNGTVTVTNAAPLAAISIVNTRGSVDLGLPDSAAFVLNAQTRNGDMENDFGLSPVGNSESRTLHGNVHDGGPTVTISTTDGDVTVRKVSLPPLPATPPAPPQLSLTPPPRPKSPASPKKAPKSPVAVTGTF